MQFLCQQTGLVSSYCAMMLFFGKTKDFLKKSGEYRDPQPPHLSMAQQCICGKNGSKTRQDIQEILRNLRSQSFISWMAELIHKHHHHPDINLVSSFSRCLNVTFLQDFIKRNHRLNTKLHLCLDEDFFFNDVNDWGGALRF